MRRSIGAGLRGQLSMRAHHSRSSINCRLPRSRRCFFQPPPRPLLQTHTFCAPCPCSCSKPPARAVSRFCRRPDAFDSKPERLFPARVNQRGRALIIDIWSSGGTRTNLADGMGAPTSSLASLEWRPRRTTVYCSPSAEDSSPNRQRCCKKTTASQAWIAEYLGMKNAANVSRAIHIIALSWIEKNVSAKFTRFIPEKMKENEH